VRRIRCALCPALRFTPNYTFRFHDANWCAGYSRWIQVMYLSFYLSALYHLHGVERVATSFLAGWKAPLLVGAVLVTGAVGIPLRFYLLSSVAFDFRKLGATFRRLFPFVLVLDQLWAVAPFLLLPEIGVGLAFAATAALLYVPFSERTLVRLGYRDNSS
jgi:hypothetical protein